MASPPFNIAQTVPADDDFVSPYPAAERTFRDVVESWFLVDGNVNGRSNKTGYDFQGSSPTGTASVTTVWADNVGNLNFRIGTGTVTPLNIPVGSILPYGGLTEPVGYIFAYGQAISRSTFAALFAVYSTTYGSGDGSTTFNVPDIRGRVIAGQDDMGGSSANRLTSPLNGDTLGATGGSESMTLVQANLPNVTFNTSIGSGQGSHTHTHNAGIQGGLSLDSGPFLAGAGSGATINAATLPSMTGTTPSGGTDTATVNIQPTIILNYIIKT